MRWATDGLADVDPMLSTRARPRAGRARRFLVVGVVLLAIAVVFAPRVTAATVVGLAVALYAATTVHRLLLIRRAGANRCTPPPPCTACC
jgi:hypothetical protein